ncbi:MAG: phosphoenolpyruvate synthase [Elusimicrobia bacterium]|nr:phosphoenolpyruvate synthase [Elusimicrobiota bacterium]
MSPDSARLPYIVCFDQIGIGDIPSVGGKNASLGEMVRELGSRGVRVPNGFAVTASAYRHFVTEAGLERTIAEQLRALDVADTQDVARRGRTLREALLAAALPEDLRTEIVEAYGNLSAGAEPVDVAVRSSATAEDLPEASFAGQQETFLNVQGPVALLENVKRCFASLFTDRAIHYRAGRGLDFEQLALSVGVQRMVRSELACSGVAFTLDTETGFPGIVLINAAYGLGENVVQGAVNPDEYRVFKPTLKAGFKPILRKTLGGKELRMVYDAGAGKRVRNVPVPAAERARFALNEEEILELARWACAIEDHYSAKAGRPCPMDLEWAKDGVSGELFIVQARPETVQSRRETGIVESYSIQARGPVLVSGRSVGDKIGRGRVRVLRGPSYLDEFQPGEILVADKTDPDWEPVMKKAAAIVTNRGGRTCHAAIVSRELGIPAVVGTETGTAALQTGRMVTVSCAEGETGFVYDGEVPFQVERVDLKALGRPRVKIMMNVANPEEAFKLSFLPNSGVGLAREEFIISNWVKVHPLALVHPERVESGRSREEIERLTEGYSDKPRYFVDRLAEGVALIAAAFYPKDVIVRLSDFKTNEYANLIGGGAFEPHEDNPMIGFRGASRYYDPRYREGFALECRAMLKVRRDMGLKNVKLMIPFCRTVEEGGRVLAELAKHGLARGEDGLEVYVMCEIPSNVILAAQFAEIFDGFSIGSNDLTQLVLGVDRDSEILAPLFDERDDAVRRMVIHVIRAAKAHGRKIGICGQAPSDYPDFAQFLVSEGIDSISLNPDAVLKTTRAVLELEARPAGEKRARQRRNGDRRRAQTA